MQPQPRVGDPAPRPPRALTEEEIVDNRRTDAPTATILCVTFQAAEFVHDALSSLLSQRSPYPFKVIVRDDGSSDGTQEILQEYARRYPKTVEIILEKENTYERVRPFSAFCADSLGDYILLCEGDDYWQDELKLVKQVSSLMNRPDLVASFHDSVVIQDGKILSTSRLLGKGRDYGPAELLSGARMTADTLCFRNVGIPVSPYELRFTGWIKVIRTLLGEYGGAIFQNDIIPSVYRVHERGLASGLDGIESPISSATTNYWIAATLAERGHHEAATRHLERSASQILSASSALGIRPHRAQRLRKFVQQKEL